MARFAGTVRRVLLPGCKSLSARALVLAACASGESRIRGLSDSDDTRRLLAALETLGAGIRAGSDGAEQVVRGWGGPPRASRVRIDVGAGGTTLRFLVPLLAAGRSDVEIRGDPRLFARPQEPLFAFLRDLGAHLESLAPDEDGRPGVRVHGTGLAGGEWRPPVAQSSQFLSGLLLAAGWCGGVKVVLPGELPSAGYLDLTLEAMRAFRGAQAVRAVPEGLMVAPGEPRASEYAVPGDPSAATFFLVALALRGGAAAFHERWSPVHPEARLLRHLFDAGILAAENTWVCATGQVPQEPLVFDLDAAPDAGPALAVLGAALPAGVRLERVGRLRLKESDRVEGILRLLRCLGAPAREEDGALLVAGGGLDPERLDPAATAAGGGFDPDGDHRLAMAAGIAALRVPGLSVRDPDCVAKSFPRFWEEREAWMAA